MHGITSSEFDFGTVMSGWAKAGIRAVEPDLEKAQAWEEVHGKGSARQVLDDLGMSAYSSTNQLFLEVDSPRRAAALESLRWKVEMAESLGADRLVVPSAARGEFIHNDYEQVLENLHEAAEIARPHGITLMLEFTRISQIISTLRTSLHLVRTLDHPNLRFMLDVFHFWAGGSKFEDLDLLRDHEVHHVHFQDTPASPHVEVFEMKDRAFPGEGIAPLQRILNKLVEKDYNRALSLELFDMTVRSTDPEIVAGKAISTITPYIEGLG